MCHGAPEWFRWLAVRLKKRMRQKFHPSQSAYDMPPSFSIAPAGGAAEEGETKVASEPVSLMICLQFSLASASPEDMGVISDFMNFGACTLIWM